MMSGGERTGEYRDTLVQEIRKKEIGRKLRIARIKRTGFLSIKSGFDVSRIKTIAQRIQQMSELDLINEAGRDAAIELEGIIVEFLEEKEETSAILNITITEDVTRNIFTMIRSKKESNMIHALKLGTAICASDAQEAISHFKKQEVVDLTLEYCLDNKHVFQAFCFFLANIVYNDEDIINYIGKIFEQRLSPVFKEYYRDIDCAEDIIYFLSTLATVYTINIRNFIHIDFCFLMIEKLKLREECKRDTAADILVFIASYTRFYNQHTESQEQEIVNSVRTFFMHNLYDIVVMFLRDEASFQRDALDCLINVTSLDSEDIEERLIGVDNFYENLMEVIFESHADTVLKNAMILLNNIMHSLDISIPNMIVEAQKVLEKVIELAILNSTNDLGLYSIETLFVSFQRCENRILSTFLGDRVKEFFTTLFFIIKGIIQFVGGIDKLASYSKRVKLILDVVCIVLDDIGGYRENQLHVPREDHVIYAFDEVDSEAHEILNGLAQDSKDPELKKSADDILSLVNSFIQDRSNTMSF